MILFEHDLGVSRIIVFKGICNGYEYVGGNILLKVCIDDEVEGKKLFHCFCVDRYTKAKCDVMTVEHRFEEGGPVVVLGNERDGLVNVQDILFYALGIISIPAVAGIQPGLKAVFGRAKSVKDILDVDTNRLRQRICISRWNKNRAKIDVFVDDTTGVQKNIDYYGCVCRKKGGNGRA